MLAKQHENSMLILQVNIAENIGQAKKIAKKCDSKTLHLLELGWTYVYNMYYLCATYSVILKISLGKLTRLILTV